MTLLQRNGNDLVMTPPELARLVVDHFKPTGRCLEPCRGAGSFYRLLPAGSGWCEITEGRDFYDFSGRVDWIVTNPPWSQIRSFLNKALSVADDVVFLCLVNAFWFQRRLIEIEAAGFGVAEILLVSTPPRPWPWSGMQLGATHLKRGHDGPITLTDGRRP